MHRLSRLIATGFFAGYAPKAPGTVGSLLGLFLYWAIPNSESPYFLILIALLFFMGVWAATQIEKETGTKDNQIIVVDEIAGMLVTVLLFEKTFGWLAIAFIIFRLFDIIKPFPVKLAEKLPNGWGVMMDDVIAGIYAAISLRLIFYFVS